MSMFSVIIPSYNRADLIKQTLASVLDQNVDVLQIIVVDDGSTDGTPAAVRSFGDRITLLHQENKGPGAARNLGLRAATSEYVAFLDSDDLWFPWTAETYAAVIKQQGRPVFVAGKPFVFEGNPNILPTRATPLNVTSFSDYLASGDQWRWFSASSFVMERKSLLAAGGFADDWINGEDLIAALNMGVAGKFVQINSPFTFGYLQHAGSAVSNIDRSLGGVNKLIEYEAAGRFPGGPRRSLERRRIISMFARTMCFQMLNCARRGCAWKIYARTFRWHVSLRRWKFLIGFPPSLILSTVRTLKRTNGTP